MKTCSFIYLFIVCALLAACREKITPSRQVTALNREIYYGNKSVLGDQALVDIFSADMRKSFLLDEIEKTTAEQEIRIYYFSPFLERFYTQTINKGIVTASLYNCGARRRGDSLFMKTGEVIILKDEARKWINTDALPAYKMKMNRDTSSLCTDCSSIYFIEVNSKGKIKRMLVDRVLELADSDPEAKCIVNFIKQISETYSFNTWDSWDKAKVNALPVRGE